MPAFRDYFRSFVQKDFMVASQYSKFFSQAQLAQFRTEFV